MDIGLILLTYKGKILLTNKENNLIVVDKTPWCFINGLKEKNKSFEESLVEKVERETGLKLEQVQYLSGCVYKGVKRLFYHSTLNDRDVNNIIRNEGKVIQFFSLEELEKLSLSVSSRLLILKHKLVIQSLEN